MKKSLVISLVFILIAAATGFSADFDFTVKGDGAVTWGLDLDNTASGFLNEATSNLIISLVAEQNKEKGTDADGAVYGYIFLEKFKMVADDATFDWKPPTITAKIVAKPLYIKICNENNDLSDPAPIKPNKASIYSGIASTLNIATRDIIARDYTGFTNFASGGGMEIGVDTDVVDVALQVESWGNFVDGTLNVANRYALGLTSTITPVTGLNFDVAAGTVLGVVDTTDITASASVSYEIAISDTMALIPLVGADFTFGGNTAIDMTSYGIEVGGGVRLKWAGTYDADKDTMMYVWDGTDDGKKVFSGLTVGANMGMGSITIGGVTVESNPELNMIISAYEDSGDDGLLPIIGMALLVEVGNLTAANGGEMDLGLAAFVDATINGLRPYASVKAIHLQNDPAGALVLDPMQVWVTVGVDIPVFANTTLTLQWKTDDLMADASDGVVGATGRDGKLGDITVKAKIAF